MSSFTCPLCTAPLTRAQGSYRCPSGHCFDVAASGYTHLLPPDQKHSKSPGDDKGMVAARSAFLDRGYYAPLRDALCQTVAEHAVSLSAPTLLDSGCGEGYYTAGLHAVLSSAGHAPNVVGVDISKFALKRAAKRLPQGEFAVASVYHLPLADHSVDLLTNVFSPLADQEFARVLRPGGRFFYVVPGALHLWEMKQVLYDEPYENPQRREDYPGFCWTGASSVSYPVTLDRSEDVMALFGMTPYAWKTPRAGVERLASLDQLTTQIQFNIHSYRRL